MAAINASVNLFALLDGNDPGDKRLVDFETQLMYQPKKKLASAVGCKYKLKLMKQPSPPALAARKSPTPAVPAGLRSEAAPRNNPKPAVAAVLRPAAASQASMARSMNKQTTTPAMPPAPARNTNLTGVLFTYPSARERIFKQRQERMEEYERRQAKAAENVSGHSGDDGKSAAAPSGASPASHGRGKKEVTGLAQAKEPAVAPAVLKTPPPPPKLEDIDQFPSLK